MPVENLEKRRALDQIEAAISGFRQRMGFMPSTCQVGSELFRRAFPNKLYPHYCGNVGETLVVPRPDVCGLWAIVIPKPREVKSETESAV